MAVCFFLFPPPPPLACHFKKLHIHEPEEITFNIVKWRERRMLSRYASENRRWAKLAFFNRSWLDGKRYNRLPHTRKSLIYELMFVGVVGFCLVAYWTPELKYNERFENAVRFRQERHNEAIDDEKYVNSLMDIYKYVTEPP